MRLYLFFLIVGLWIICLTLTAQPQTTPKVSGTENVQAQTALNYYLLYIKNVPIGYIAVESATDIMYQNVLTHVRKTRTAIKTQLGAKGFDSQVLEETWFQKDKNIVVYSCERIWQNQLVGTMRYMIDDAQLRAIQTKAGQKIGDSSMSISPGVICLGDYFSIVSLLERAGKNPATFSVVELKQVLPDSSRLEPNAMLVKPLGNQVLTIQNIRYNTLCYQIEQQQNILKIWLSANDHNKILQIQDIKKDLRIEVATPEKIQDISQIPLQSFFKKLRPLPYNLGQPYRYEFMYDGKSVGNMTFTVNFVAKSATAQVKPGEQISSADTVSSYYEITSLGNFTRRDQKPYTIQSLTRYTENFQPLYYEMNESNGNQIKCEFTSQGVKEHFYYQENLLENFLSLSPDTLFVDNNAIHHFAVALTQCPLEVGSKFSFSVFHPRRLQSTPGEFRVLSKNNQMLTISFATSFHTLQLLVGIDGMLYQYKQEKLEVNLKK